MVPPIPRDPLSADPYRWCAHETRPPRAGCRWAIAPRAPRLLASRGDLRPPALRPFRRRYLRAGQADPGASPDRRPTAVHPDRLRVGGQRGSGAGPHQPAHRAGRPADRGRDRSAEAGLRPDGDGRGPLPRRPARRGGRGHRPAAGGHLRGHHRGRLRPDGRDRLRGQRGAPALPVGEAAQDPRRRGDRDLRLPRIVKQTYQWGSH